MKSIQKNKYFFGWENWKWLIKELVHIYTNKSSFFSKKRIESSIAFIIGQVGMLWFLYEHIPQLTISDIVLWSGVEFAMAGYIVNQIQKEKKTETVEEPKPEDI
jgi:hypothetical protein